MSKTGLMHKASELLRTNGGCVGNSVREALHTGRSCAREVPPPLALSGPDPMDAAREREEEAVRLAALQRRHELDTTVAEVLQSLATGQYGRCVECGQHIALARLRAMPLAVRCLACQERLERARSIAAARECRYKGTRIQEQEVAL